MASEISYIGDREGVAVIGSGGGWWQGAHGHTFPDGFTREDVAKVCPAVLSRIYQFPVHAEGKAPWLDDEDAETIRVAMPDRRANVRYVNGEWVYLGDVSSKYQLVQDEELFDLVENIRGEGVQFEACGHLFGGRRTWVLGRLGEDFRATENDPITPYILLANGHDGKFGLHVQATPVRVVCNNTLSMSLGRQTYVKLTHTGDMAAKVKDAARVLGLIRESIDETAEGYRRLAETPVSGEEVTEYVSALFPIRDESAGDRAVERDRAIQSAVMRDVIDAPGGAKDVGRNLWAAYNGVTHFVDHTFYRDFARSGNGGAAERRMDKIVWGPGAETKRKALDLALTLAS